MLRTVERVRFGVLGELVAVDGGAAVRIGRSTRAAVLAALLWHRTRPVSVEELIALVWGADAPSTAATMVHGAVARLRTTLDPDRGTGPGRVIGSANGGYVIGPDVGVDAVEFERLLAEGRALVDGSPEPAEPVLAEARSRWRGPAYAGIEQPFARDEAARLEELRLQCVELQADVALALGRPSARWRSSSRWWRPTRRGSTPPHSSCGRCTGASGRPRRWPSTAGSAGCWSTSWGWSRGRRCGRPRRDVLERADGMPRDAARLPAPLSSFVGREDDLARVGALLCTARLTTLTGPGGTGKTRLAVEVGRRAAADAVFVDLARARSAELFDATVAEAFGIRFDDGGLAAAVAAAVADEPVMIVLDNCEHLLDRCAAFVQELLAARGQAAGAGHQPRTARRARRAGASRPAAGARGRRRAVGGDRGQPRGAPVRRARRRDAARLRGHRRERGPGRRDLPSPRRASRSRWSWPRRGRPRSRCGRSPTGSTTVGCSTRPAAPPNRGIAASRPPSRGAATCCPEPERALFAVARGVPRRLRPGGRRRGRRAATRHCRWPTSSSAASSRPTRGRRLRFRLLETTRAFARPRTDRGRPRRTCAADTPTTTATSPAGPSRTCTAAGSGRWLAGPAPRARQPPRRAGVGGGPERRPGGAGRARRKPLALLGRAGLAQRGPALADGRRSPWSAGPARTDGRCCRRRRCCTSAAPSSTRPRPSPTSNDRLAVAAGDRGAEGDALGLAATVAWARGRFDRAQQLYEDGDRRLAGRRRPLARGDGGGPAGAAAPGPARARRGQSARRRAPPRTPTRWARSWPAGWPATSPPRSSTAGVTRAAAKRLVAEALVHYRLVGLPGGRGVQPAPVRPDRAGRAATGDGPSTASRRSLRVYRRIGHHAGVAAALDSLADGRDATPTTPPACAGIVRRRAHRDRRARRRLAAS